MTCDLHAVDPQELEHLLAEPAAVQDLCGRSLERWQSMADLWSDPDVQVRLSADPAQAEQLFGPVTPDGSMLCLEKNWHVLHFALTGSAGEVGGPLGFLMAGGTPVGDVDCGYGPARAYQPAQVQELAVALADLSDEAVRERCTAGALRAAAVYGAPPAGGDDESLAESCLYYLGELRRFMDPLCQDGHGLVVIVS